MVFVPEGFPPKNICVYYLCCYALLNGVDECLCLYDANNN